MNNTFWTDFDRRWHERLEISESEGVRRSLAIVLAHSGDSWFWLLGMGLVWILGDAAWKGWALRMGVSIVALATLVLMMKFAFRRARPTGSWGSIYRKSDPHSFPSGHAARAVLLAVLSLGLGPVWLAALLLPWAPLVALARVAMGLHYPTDVLAGGAVGLIAGLIALLIV